MLVCSKVLTVKWLNVAFAQQACAEEIFPAANGVAALH